MNYQKLQNNHDQIKLVSKKSPAYQFFITLPFFVMFPFYSLFFLYIYRGRIKKNWLFHQNCEIIHVTFVVHDNSHVEKETSHSYFFLSLKVKNKNISILLKRQLAIRKIQSKQ
jgi:hypothetical protein